MGGQAPPVPDIRVTLLGRFAAGMVFEIATMFVLCSLWQLLRRNATNRPFPGPSPRLEGPGRFLSHSYGTFRGVNLRASDRVVRI